MRDGCLIGSQWRVPVADPGGPMADGTTEPAASVRAGSVLEPPWQDAAGTRRRVGSRRSDRDLERCPLRARPCELLGPSRLGGMVGLLLSVCGHVRRSPRAASMCTSVSAPHLTGGSGLPGGGLRQTPRIAEFCLGFWAILMARRSSSSCRGYLDDTTDRSSEPFE